MTCERSIEVRVRAALSHLSDVKARRMFVSLGFMVDGKLCVSARAERIMCRIDPEHLDKVLKRKGCHTVVNKGRKCRGDVYVDADSVTTKRSLENWIDLALDFNAKISA